MPLPAPYQGSRRVPPYFVALLGGSTRAARVLGALVLGPLLVPFTAAIRVLPILASVSLAACERDYPLEPTFCDHWCGTFDRAGCDISPADCVQDCERTQGPQQCAGDRDTLLACYQATPKEKFDCNGGGAENVRVADGACRAERDALYECAEPGIGQCLTLCRAAQANVARSSLGACPLLSSSCEELCWIVAQSGDPRDAAGAEGNTSLLFQLGLLCGFNDAGMAPTSPAASQ